MYFGNGETVSYNLDIIQSLNETYVKKALGFIKRGYKSMRKERYYNVWKYTTPRRYVGEGTENLLLGDYSLSAGYYLTTDKTTGCIIRYDVTIYLEDRFNVKQRENYMNYNSVAFRNAVAWVFDFPPNKSFLVNCEKTYTFDIEKNGEVFDLN